MPSHSRTTQETRILKPPIIKMPSSFRRFWSRVYAIIAYYLGVWPAMYAFRRISGKKPLLAVFTFHRVCEDGADERHLVTYDKGVPQTLFATQIEAIKARFNVIPLDEFLSTIAGKTPLNQNSALITFDDADAEFGKCAFPVLKEHGCPSVVFVPTEFIDSRRRFWHLRVSNAFQKADKDSWGKIVELAHSFPEDRRHWLDGLDPGKREDIEQGCWRFNVAVNGMPEETIEHFVEKLEAITGPEYTLGIGTMTSTEIVELHKQGVAMESHSATHRKLRRLPESEVRKELIDSKADLEKRLNKTVRTICYPAGSYNMDVARIASETGYEAGFTTNIGFVELPVEGLDRYTIPRFDIRGSDKYEVARFLGEITIRRFEKGWPME